MEDPVADTKLMKKLYTFFFKFSSKRMAIIAGEWVLDAVKRTPEEKWQEKPGTESEQVNRSDAE